MSYYQEQNGWSKSLQDAQTIIKSLQLQPHPEGGFYRETYKSGDWLGAKSLPARYSSNRSFSTCIYYLLTSDTFSRMHTLNSDELFHFYLGSPLEMLQLLADGSGRVVRIGSNIEAGESPQVLVPAGVWLGCRVASPGEFALLGCTVAPGFEFEDYVEGKRSDLVEQYPQWHDMITALTLQ